MKTNNQVSNLYGRARRIELVEKLAYLLVAIIAVIVTIYIFSSTVSGNDEVADFAYLRKYLEAKGYSCSLIERAGGQCSLKGDASSYYFIRNDDGFEYIISSSSYTLDIKHTSSVDDTITFKTTAAAFVGYRERSYTCVTDGNIIGELFECKDESKFEVLDSDTYLGVIEQAISDLNNIIDSSGYDKDILMSDYKWVKK